MHTNFAMSLHQHFLLILSWFVEVLHAIPHFMGSNLCDMKQCMMCLMFDMGFCF